jgi:hypothetical protein
MAYRVGRSGPIVLESTGGANIANTDIVEDLTVTTVVAKTFWR